MRSRWVICSLLLVFCSYRSDGQGTALFAQPTLDRGTAVRRLLLDALEASYAHDGAWPAQLSDPSVTYSPPKPQAKPKNEVEQVWIHRRATATVVLHETFEQHRDGVWVGYADGHLEFARTPADLAACKDQLSIAKPENSAGTTQPAAKGSLTLKLLDPDGKPVQGALVGVWACSAMDRRSLAIIQNRRR